MPHKDKRKQRISAARHYQNNKTKIKARARAFTIKARERNRAFILGYKAARGCSTCSERDPRCLDFHHLRDKESEIANAVAKGWSLERLALEMEKCILQCANCHRKITFAVLRSPVTSSGS